MKKKIVSMVLAAAMAFACIPVTAYADWDEVNGNKVYISDDGERLTGFQTISGKKYYFDKDGYMVTGWAKVSGNKYYFGSDGVMRTGWLSMKNGKKYYLGDDGAMLTGFQTISGKKYYFSKEGVMKTGWLETSSGNKYYFKKDGTMAKDCTLKINGTSYTFDENGMAKEKTTMNKTPKEFEVPVLGDKKSKVLNSCGIANYQYDSEYNTYSGDVLFGGIESYLCLTFNSDDELYGYSLFIPSSYYVFLDTVSSFKSKLGYNYDYDDGKYTWRSGYFSISLQYTDLNCIMLTCLDRSYAD